MNFILVACSHNICRIYFATAINSNATMATKCNSLSDYNLGKCDGKEKIIFGENLPSDAQGTFYLNATEKYIY